MNKTLHNRLTEISQRLKNEYNAEKVILCGSYANGTGTEDSDVNLFIIAPTNERLLKRITTVLKLIRDLKKNVSRTYSINKRRIEKKN